MRDKINIYFSDIFDVDPDTLESYGAFNVSLINDLPLFIDPFLLFNSKREDYQKLHKGIIQYISFLKNRAKSIDHDDALLQTLFVFPEIKQNWLGFSRRGNRGSGLGMKFARALHKNFDKLLSNFGEEQTTKDSHLEKLCLISEGVGRDNISDFTTNLILEYLLDYTQEFARNHLQPSQYKNVPVKHAYFNYVTQTWATQYYDLPWYNGDYVILTPIDMLTKDDTWINKSDLLHDFDRIVSSVPNDSLRSLINNYFWEVLPKEPKKNEQQEAIEKVISKYPEIIDFYIRYKEEHGEQAVAQSESKVKAIRYLFIENLRNFIQQLAQETNFYSQCDGTLDAARARVTFLKDIIENKGGHRLFYSKEGATPRESDLQILFRLTWYATSFNVSREVNNGRGPVDFEVSNGAFDKTLVEFKLASNTHLKRNLEKQVEIYKLAGDAQHTLKVIVYFDEQQYSRTDKILKTLNLKKDPNIILIDARDDNKPSGSSL